ncbi:MAG TPA: hypothetical protein VFO11_07420, partial [Candidatus Polarisedimenticolaceae bacterium]|nr:hypothetical protein [Candidatus Polarisedimenticolaceae bacterium]
MGLLVRGLTLVLCALLVFTPIPAFADSPAPAEAPQVETFVAPPVSDNPQVFRYQLLDFLHGMSDALVVALDHPVIGPKLRERMNAGSVAIPLPPEAFETIERATPDEMDQLRQAFTLAPGILIAPAVLRAGLQIAPTHPVDGPSAVSCTDMYNDYNQIPGLTQVSKDLTIANNVVGLLKIILGTASGVLNAAMTTCESPIDIPLSWAQIPLIIVVGVVDLVTLALGTAVDSVSFQITDLWRCINLANCPPQGFTERFRPDTASDLKGRGCDERDNNCTGGIDELSEDVFAPQVSIDATLAARCFVDPVEAEAAARLAVHAGDDCTDLAASPNAHQGTLNVVYSRGACLGSLTATATDLRGNVGAANTLFAVDDLPPAIALQNLSGTCQPSVAAARQALQFTATDACSTPQTIARVLEKECVADFEFQAEDACGNRSSARQSVRIDDSPPAVKVQTLLLPAYEGRFCFGTEATAIATVSEAAAIADNCTARADLTLSTVAQPVQGKQCDRRIVAGATDTCTLQGEDAVVVRLDDQMPTVSCTVLKPILWPADSTMVNVGFQYQLQDNCGATDVKLDVAVTSDEPTSFNLPVGGAGDPAPDAVVQYGADG